MTFGQSTDGVVLFSVVCAWYCFMQILLTSKQKILVGMYGWYGLDGFGKSHPQREKQCWFEGTTFLQNVGTTHSTRYHIPRDMNL